MKWLFSRVIFFFFLLFVYLKLVYLYWWWRAFGSVCSVTGCRCWVECRNRVIFCFMFEFIQCLLNRQMFNGHFTSVGILLAGILLLFRWVCGDFKWLTIGLFVQQSKFELSLFCGIECLCLRFYHSIEMNSLDQRILDIVLDDGLFGIRYSVWLVFWFLGHRKYYIIGLLGIDRVDYFWLWSSGDRIWRYNLVSRLITRFSIKSRYPQKVPDLYLVQFQNHNRFHNVSHCPPLGQPTKQQQKNRIFRSKWV